VGVVLGVADGGVVGEGGMVGVGEGDVVIVGVAVFDGVAVAVCEGVSMAVIVGGTPVPVAVGRPVGLSSVVLVAPSVVRSEVVVLDEQAVDSPPNRNESPISRIRQNLGTRSAL
jgi:hypothetical protein